MAASVSRQRSLPFRKELTVAQKGWLITLRRLCVKHGSQMFPLDTSRPKGLTVDQVVGFFKRCDDVVLRDIQPPSVGAIRYVWLERVG